MSGGGNGKFDLDKAFGGAGKVTIEKEETPQDADHRRRKDMILFVVALTLLVIVIAVCGWVILFSGEPAELKNNATHLVTLFIGGALGYVFGKKTD
ncbi:MAG TPA: hypothetical protein VG891_03140 [Rhizomicrobium sp.]|nr:hypothetical protein [Rhizomicrobium sp.]